MRRRPRDIRERLFDPQTIRSAVLQGFSLCLIAFAAFGVSLYRGQGELDARAITFTTLVLGNIALIWANRSRSRTILQMLRSRNKPLWSITAAAALLLSVVLYVPAARNVFQFSNLHVNDILVCIGLALLSVTGIEIMKLRHAE